MKKYKVGDIVVVNDERTSDPCFLGNGTFVVTHLEHPDEPDSYGVLELDDRDDEHPYFLMYRHQDSGAYKWTVIHPEILDDPVPAPLVVVEEEEKEHEFVIGAEYEFGDLTTVFGLKKFFGKRIKVIDTHGWSRRVVFSGSGDTTLKLSAEKAREYLEDGWFTEKK